MYEALQKHCDKKHCGLINDTLVPWLKTLGYPVVTVSKSDSKANTYVVKQERFVYDKSANVETKGWSIYFRYKTGLKGDKVVFEANKWVTGDQGEITWDGVGWIKGNVDQTGFYRVNYDAKTWKGLTEQLEHIHTGAFTEADRYGLIDDAFNLARGGRLNITTALNLIGYLRNETSYLPWLAVHKNLEYILGILPVDSNVYRQLKRFLAYQSKPLYDKLGTDDTGSHLDKCVFL
ncbi:glutamyl aminopeptidase-like [Actinia tenebrosa]|uniref:Glutamyl aminopeptidase-like n=1 Tax=Actinia tenebrosa TaxID=6105 RepID=A0A6P8HMX7_ACTTE|nr:glutamyl aminopeptidase-like [Actinia tenebrosa]